MSRTMNCDQCRQLLFDIVDANVSQESRAAANLHMDECPECSAALAELWQLSAAASRWQDRPVPWWNRQARFFEGRSWFPVLQIASGFASLLVMVLVLAQVQVSTSDGLVIRLGGTGITEQQLTAKLDELRTEQYAMVNARLDRLASEQVSSNQLLVNMVLEANRQERQEDVANLLALLEDSQTQQQQRTAAGLRFVIGNQIEDRRNIKQLSDALRLVASDGGTF